MGDPSAVSGDAGLTKPGTNDAASPRAPGAAKPTNKDSLSATAEPAHPVVQAISPLLERIGANFVDAHELRTDDVPLEWDGEVIGGIRLTATLPLPGDVLPPSEEEGAGETGGGLDGIILDIERFFGTPLADLPRARKQQAVRMFEEGGAFSYRKSVESVAAALGISRFTVYNYLNRDRA